MPNLPKISPPGPWPQQRRIAVRRQSPPDLDLGHNASDQSRVEDWEQFFVEKSERRALKSRRESRQQQVQIAIIFSLIAALVLGGIALITAL